MVFCRSADRSCETESDITNFSSIILLPTSCEDIRCFEAVAQIIKDPQNRDHANSILRAMRSGAPVLSHADFLAELRSLENRVVRVRCEGSGDNAYAHVHRVSGREAQATWLLTRRDVLRYRDHPQTTERVRRLIDAALIGENELVYADWPDTIPLASLREPVPLRLITAAPPARPGPGLYCRFLCRCAVSSLPTVDSGWPADAATYSIDMDPRWTVLAMPSSAATRGCTVAALAQLVAGYEWRVAVAMARHRRLGAGTLLGLLDDRLLADIADAAGVGAGWAM